MAVRHTSEAVRREQPFASSSSSPAPAARLGFAATRRRNAATGRNNSSSLASTTTAPPAEKQQRDAAAPGAAAAAGGGGEDVVESKDVMDRGLGLRRALSDETQSRPFQPLGGEVLHIGWLRTESDSGKVTRIEAGPRYRLNAVDP
jgi:hypothetical protein